MNLSLSRHNLLEQFVVTAEQMRQIEGRIFAAGMPVAALMEKVAQLITQRIMTQYPLGQYLSVGILVGPGHNGGDALVVARELHFHGYEVRLCRPLSKLKPLTQNHADYGESLGIPWGEKLEFLNPCQLIIDGLFGFGLTRSLSGSLENLVNQLNQWEQPVISIDLPSGIHTDTGEVLGTAVQATETFCLGLWKQAFFQDQSLEYQGNASLIDFGIPLGDIEAILSPSPAIQVMTKPTVSQYLPLPRPSVTHKYRQGNLLLICGSHTYAGSAILTGLGARASGVGMLSIAVPESLKPILVSHLPEALIIGCPETNTGAIARLPQDLVLEKFDGIGCGPGLTITPETITILQTLIEVDCPLILDADGLNILAKEKLVSALSSRSSSTVLTPHLGEFRRLFPHIHEPEGDRIRGVTQGAQESRTIILFKGSRSIIASPQGKLWLIPKSTPALARGGSGDVLTGLMGGLMAQNPQGLETVVATAGWWHAQAGILAQQERTELGVDAFTLTQYLIPTLIHGQ